MRTLGEHGGEFVCDGCGSSVDVVWLRNGTNNEPMLFGPCACPEWTAEAQPALVAQVNQFVAEAHAGVTVKRGRGLALNR